MAVSKDTMLEAFLNSVKEKVKAAGYSHYTVGMEILAEEAFKHGKSVDDAMATIGKYITIDDCKCVTPLTFAPDCRPALDIPKEPDPTVDPGVALFEAYATAKKNLTDKLKSVLAILAACNNIEIGQGDEYYDAKYIGQNINTFANHQWRYCEGHQKIYCQHTYYPTSGKKSITVKVPVKYLGMTDDEIWDDNKDLALKALNEKKASLERKRAAVLRPVDEKISVIEEQIKSITEHNAEELLKREEK